MTWEELGLQRESPVSQRSVKIVGKSAEPKMGLNSLCCTEFKKGGRVYVLLCLLWRVELKMDSGRVGYLVFFLF